MFKHKIIGVTIICICLITALVRSFMAWPDTHLHFVMCDVGQGDALLLTHGFTQIVVDAGKDDSVLLCLDKFIPFWDRTLEMVVITHPDFDHYGGVKEVLERYEVKSLAQLPIAKKDPEFELLQSIVQAKKQAGMQVVFPVAGETLLSWGRLHIEVVWPAELYLDSLPETARLAETQLSDITQQENTPQIDANPLSISLLMDYNDTRFLLTGDLEQPHELALIQSPLMTPVDVLKVGHHGSKTSTTRPFLQSIQPEIAMVSVGKNNRYKHPDGDVLSRLEEYVGRQIFRTDIQGTVHLVSDGNQIWMQ